MPSAFCLSVRNCVKKGIQMISKELIPDKIRTWVGPFANKNDYINTGKEIFNLILKYYNLKNANDILDAGCGCGRIAIHLLHFLNKNTKYYGFDICPEHIEWCKKHIESKYNNFKFYHLDIKKEAYNPQGTLELSDTKLPYKDKSFDFIIAHSLFTHMLSNEFEYYISEFKRILRKNGFFYASYYLYNDERKIGIKNNTSCLNFNYKINDCYTFDKNNPEEAIAQIEKNVINVYNKNNFEITIPINYSKWSINKEFSQDFIIARSK